MAKNGILIVEFRKPVAAKAGEDIDKRHPKRAAPSIRPVNDDDGLNRHLGVFRLILDLWRWGPKPVSLWGTVWVIWSAGWALQLGATCSRRYSTGWICRVWGRDTRRCGTQAKAELQAPATCLVKPGLYTLFIFFYWGI